MTAGCMIMGRMMSMAQPCLNLRRPTMMRWGLGSLLKPMFRKVLSLVP